MEPKDISYSQLSLLAERTRFYLYSEYKKENKDESKMNIYQRFIEAYSLGKYEDLFVIWHGGLEQMQGRNLISVVKELLG